MDEIRRRIIHVCMAQSLHYQLYISAGDKAPPTFTDFKHADRKGAFSFRKLICRPGRAWGRTKNRKSAGTRFSQ